MLIRFLQWFIDPLGYIIIPKEDYHVIQCKGIRYKLIIEHEPEVKDNVVRLDKYV